MQSLPIHQDNNILLKERFKNIRQQVHTSHQEPVSETQAEETHQATTSEADFTVLSKPFQEINLTNLPSSTKAYIVQKLTSLQNKGNRLRQQQEEISKKSTKQEDVLEYQVQNMSDEIVTLQCLIFI